MAVFAATASPFTILTFAVLGESRHEEPHVVGTLRNKRAELAGMGSQLEQQMARPRTNLAHLDATMRLFDPVTRPLEIRPKQPRARIALFRRGACLRLIYHGQRNAPEPLTKRDLAEQIMRAKPIPAAMTAATSRSERRLSAR